MCSINLAVLPIVNFYPQKSTRLLPLSTCKTIGLLC